jgi:Fic family protein
MDMHYKIILNTRIPSDLVNFISEIDEFKGRWDYIKNLSPESLSRLRKVATIASIGSSTRIEGVKLSNTEIEKLLQNIGRHSFRSRDEEEVAGYAEAMNLVFDNYDIIPVTENHIKQLHGILLKFSSKDEGHKGKYKIASNSVNAFDENGKGAGVIFETASPYQTQLYMPDLVAWYNREIQEHNHHPLLIIGGFVVHFLAIHPFQDGNGRLSRILTTLMLLKAGYAYVSYCSLESIVEENKNLYYVALRKAQQTFKTNHGGMEEWMRYFLHTLKKQKDILNQRLSEEKSFVFAEMPALSTAILNYALSHPRITVADIVAFTKANRNTIKKNVKSLVDRKFLIQHGSGKGTWYTTPA